MTEKDPRVYFAAERTLLAWIRTGVGVIGLGFVVARFGLFLRLLEPNHPESQRSFASAWIGILLVVTGGLFTTCAGLQFAAFLKILTTEEKPRTGFTPTLSLVLAFSVGASGLLLGAYLSTSGL